MSLEEHFKYQSPELLKLDFEQYLRYRQVSEIIASLSYNNSKYEPIKILEVGCNILNLLPRFLGASNVSIIRCDIEDFSSQVDDFIKLEENAPLPFQDASFDIVVAVDVIEHIKKEQRKFYVGEWSRVSRLAMIFSCPNGVAEVMDAERQVNDAYRLITGSDHPWLIEHIILGLPTESEICGILKEWGLEYLICSNSDLTYWLPLLILQQRLSMVSGHESWLEQLNVIMNTRNNDTSFENCPYRKIYVAVKQRELLNQLSELEDNKDCLESKISYSLNTIVHMAEVTRDLMQSLDIRRDCDLQIFWDGNGDFCESNSIKARLIADGAVHQYDLLLPAKANGRLRVDPANQPAFVEIESIELYSVNQDGLATNEPLASLSVENNFEGIMQGLSTIKVSSRGTYSIFCANEDPQLFLNGISVPECKNNYILRLRISINMGISRGIAKVLESVINTQKEELNLQTGELTRHQVDIAGKGKQLSDQAGELTRLQVELTGKEEQLICQAGELTRLHTELTGKEEQFIRILNSKSWKIIAPLRCLLRRTRKMKREIKCFIPMIIGKKFYLKINPFQQLEPDELKEYGFWKSLGNDPQFNIQGFFPVGWVEISWCSASDVLLPLTLYWGDESGMNEGQSLTFGSILPGEINHQNAVVYINPMAEYLRLDPGDRSGNLFLSDITITKLSRLHIFIRAVMTFFKDQRISYSRLHHLFKKATKVLLNEGMRGIWDEAKNKILPQSYFMDYDVWLRNTELTDVKRENILSQITELNHKPLISLIVPVYDTEECWLRKCIESVKNQFYNNWELCIADDASTKPHVRKILDGYASEDARIKVIYREKNGHISAASNSALELATGEFIALLDHDDELTPDALYENVLLLNQHPDADMIYSDEDKIDEDGNRHTPFFKPDWSPDTFLSQMYTCHLGVYRTELIRQIGGFRIGFEGSQDYDLVLRFTEKTDKIFHIPKILYHWRTIAQSTASSAGSKEYTHKAGLKAIQEALERRGENAYVETVENYSNIYRVHYLLSKEPCISIIIPTRDMAETLSACINSVFKKSTYQNFEVIVVDNGSKHPDTNALLKMWEEKEPKRFRVIHLDIPFNFAKLNNEAVQVARGELILLLNNDIEIVTPNWLEEMAGYVVRPNVGAVGAMLLYPDNTIQHAGVILGIKGVANHSHKGYSKYSPGYFGRLLSVSNYSAVTGACLMVKKIIYQMVNGLDEQLAVAFNDIDFCIKLTQKGLYNLVLPYIQIYHYESKSRGYEDTPEKQERFLREVNFMKERWGELLTNDPFYNSNLTLEREDFSLRNPR